MYFDDKDYMFRTHVILQDIKKYGGTKVFLEARKILLVAWLACSEGEHNPQFPSLNSFDYLLRNLEDIKSDSQKRYHYGNMTSLRETLGYYPHYVGNGYYFSIPYCILKDKTPQQIQVNIEKYILTERRFYLEQELREADAPVILDHIADHPWDFVDDDGDLDDLFFLH